MKGTVLGIEKKEIYDKHIKRIVNAKVHLNIVLIKLPDINLITGTYNSKYKLDKMQAGIINIKLNKKLTPENIRSLSNPEQYTAYESPEPISPNMAVLPLLSHERCYGPWMSASQIDSSTDRYSDIGGKVEYVKDENLSPFLIVIINFPFL